MINPDLFKIVEEHEIKTITEEDFDPSCFEEISDAFPEGKLVNPYSATHEMRGEIKFLYNKAGGFKS